MKKLIFILGLFSFLFLLAPVTYAEDCGCSTVQPCRRIICPGCGDEVPPSLCTWEIDDSCGGCISPQQCSGGFCVNPTCTPNWVNCSRWTPDPSTRDCGSILQQTRTCTDSNNCGISCPAAMCTRFVTGTKCNDGFICQDGTCQAIATCDSLCKVASYAGGTCSKNTSPYYWLNNSICYFGGRASIGYVGGCTGAITTGACWCSKKVDSCPVGVCSNLGCTASNLSCAAACQSKGYNNGYCSFNTGVKICDGDTCQYNRFDTQIGTQLECFLNHCWCNNESSCADCPTNCTATGCAGAPSCVLPKKDPHLDCFGKTCQSVPGCGEDKECIEGDHKFCGGECNSDADCTGTSQGSNGLTYPERCCLESTCDEDFAMCVIDNNNPECEATWCDTSCKSKDDYISGTCQEINGTPSCQCTSETGEVCSETGSACSIISPCCKTPDDKCCEYKNAGNFVCLSSPLGPCPPLVINCPIEGQTNPHWLCSGESCVEKNFCGVGQGCNTNPGVCGACTPGECSDRRYCSGGAWGEQDSLQYCTLCGEGIAAMHCSDGVKNCDEVNLDCGGSDCSPCSATCGNGTVESPDEDCDGSVPEGKDCFNIPGDFTGGTLSCDPLSCKFTGCTKNGGPGPGPGPGGGVKIELKNPLNAKNFTELVDNLINFAFTLGIVLAPLFYIIAGFYFVTAAGDAQKVTTAKNIILWTSIGLGIILFARGLIYVLKSVIGG